MACTSGAVQIIEAELTRERTHAGLQAARDRGRVGGRPTAMTDERRQVAQRMLDGGYRPTQVADTLGVSRTTIYRHLGHVPGMRYASQGSGA